VTRKAGVDGGELGYVGQGHLWWAELKRLVPGPRRVSPFRYPRRRCGCGAAERVGRRPAMHIASREAEVTPPSPPQLQSASPTATTTPTWARPGWRAQRAGREATRSVAMWSEASRCALSAHRGTPRRALGCSRPPASTPARLGDGQARRPTALTVPSPGGGTPGEGSSQFRTARAPASAMNGVEPGIKIPFCGEALILRSTPSADLNEQVRWRSRLSYGHVSGGRRRFRGSCAPPRRRVPRLAGGGHTKRDAVNGAPLCAERFDQVSAGS
jgi:hypothetical protein